LCLKNEVKNEPHAPLAHCYRASFPAFEMSVKTMVLAQKEQKMRPLETLQTRKFNDINILTKM
jgi:hypothetical protein